MVLVVFVVFVGDVCFLKIRVQNPGHRPCTTLREPDLNQEEQLGMQGRGCAGRMSRSNVASIIIIIIIILIIILIINLINVTIISMHHCRYTRLEWPEERQVRQAFTCWDLECLTDQRCLIR